MGLLLSGNNPAAYKTAERTYFTATAGQTTFTLTSGYAPGDIDVFMNGVRLVESDDFFAVDGSTITLNAAASAGDHLAVICYYQFKATGHWTKAESDGRYMTASGSNPMTSYLRTPNYGITSTSDTLSASLEASAFAGEQGVGIKAFGRSVATTGGSILYTADNRGASGAHKFGFWNGTSFTTTMNIDSTGRVSKPYQPSWHLSPNFSGSSGNLGSTHTIPFASTGGAFRNFIQGGASVSSGVVTVPIAGKYWVGASWRQENIQTDYEISIFVNGVQSIRSGIWYTSQAYENAHVFGILNLAANDTLYVRLTGGGASNSYSGYTDCLTFFSGHLIG